MKGINKAILIGNVGKDPEVQSFESGRKKAAFSLATTERYKDKTGTEQVITDWHNIVVWGPQAEVAEKYIRKGTPLYVEGRIKYREYEAQDGQKKRITEIIADTFSMLGSGTGNQGRQDSAEIPPKSEPDDPSLTEINDDLPF